ncbi:hypothetical protein TNCV_1071181 [Trichonephila clavipes]|nr:hypothetical protein TNCV_1071181 [Trichonephila clavipes]
MLHSKPPKIFVQQKSQFASPQQSPPLSIVSLFLSSTTPNPHRGVRAGRFLARQEQLHYGRFIQEVQLLTPSSSSLETFSTSPFTLSGVVSCPRVRQLVSVHL